MPTRLLSKVRFKLARNNTYVSRKAGNATDHLVAGAGRSVVSYRSSFLRVEDHRFESRSPLLRRNRGLTSPRVRLSRRFRTN